MHRKCLILYMFLTRLVSSNYLLTVQHHWHRNDHRKVFRRTLVVVLHRQHCARSFAHQHHHRRVVDEFFVSARNVKPAKRIGRRGGGDRSETQRRSNRERTKSVEHTPDGYTKLVSAARALFQFWRRILSSSWMLKIGAQKCLVPLCAGMKLTPQSPFGA